MYKLKLPSKATKIIYKIRLMLFQFNKYLEKSPTMPFKLRLRHFLLLGGIVMHRQDNNALERKIWRFRLISYASYRQYNSYLFISLSSLLSCVFVNLQSSRLLLLLSFAERIFMQYAVVSLIIEQS